MDLSEPPSSGGARRPGYPPADLRRRTLARLIDSLVALAPLFVLPPGHRLAGLFSSAALLLCGDSLFGQGRSLGKRLAGLRTILLASRRPASISACLRRNAIFALSPAPALLASFALPPGSAPSPLVVTCVALLALLSLEASFALQPLTRDLGQRRLGDLFAGTQVIDASLPLGLALPRGKPLVAAAAPLASRAALDSASQPSSRPQLGHPEDDACASP